MFGLDALFDFDHDGELDTFETATQYYAISGEFDEDETNDWNEDEEEDA